MMPYVKKKYINNFSWLFSSVGNKARNLSQRNYFAWKLFMKIIMYFSSIGHRIISYIAKFEVKIPLVRREKKRNLSRGRLDQLKLLGEVHWV